jgi:Dolichyl-phosphate-mannose-protein mannosyltransferase
MVSQPRWRAFLQLVHTPWRLAAAALLLALFAGNLYRAATQSITHDEAVTWQWFLSGPFSLVFDSPMGNHHPLHTLACKLTTGVLGTSEFSLRIPSLLGGLFYFFAVYRLSAFLFGGRFLFLLSVAFLSLNPFVLDYLSCARGYSAGLALLLWTVYLLMRYLTEPGDPRLPSRPARLLNQAGIALGLAIGVNVIMVFPAGALAAVFLSLLIADRAMAQPAPAKSARKDERRKPRQAPAAPVRSAWQALIHFAVPAVAVGGVISLLPRKLVTLEPGTGPTSLRAILEGAVRPSLFHSPGRPGLAGWLSPELAVQLVTLVAVPAGFAALLLLAGKIVHTWVRRRSLDALPAVDRFLLVVAGLLLTALLMILTSRYVLLTPYPEQRTVLYWIPLLGLACVGIAKRLFDGRGPLRLLAWALSGFLVLCIVQFATQFNTRYYAEWAYCAATKDMMAAIRSRHALNPAGPVRLGVTWQLEPGVNFYRTMWGLNWIEQVYRESPDNDNDYYLLLYGDVGLVERRGLKPLIEDRLSGAVLAQAGGR